METSDIFPDILRSRWNVKFVGDHKQMNPWHVQVSQMKMSLLRLSMLSSSFNFSYVSNELV